MLKIGLTGNMGSGKSTVASIFGCLNIPVYHADEEAKKMYLRQDVKASAVELLGLNILDANGEIDRSSVASLAFADPILLKKLTFLIHPLVRDDFREWLLHQPATPYIIHETAILFESGFRNEVDLVIHVSCPETLAIERIQKRDRLPEEKIRERMRFQMKDSEKASRSDFVIINDGRTLVIPQVLEIHQELLQRSP
ncbi:MAG: dephospho-CoA kinase [bacterium]